MERVIRAFVAVPLALDVNDAIGTWLREQWQGSALRFTRADNRHVTIKFLGNVNPAALPKIEGALAAAAQRLAGRAGRLEVAGLGFFPSAENPHVLWAGFEDPAGFLDEVFRTVENELRELGFSRDDRPFHAHVTLSRIKEALADEDRRRAEAGMGQRFGAFTPDRLVFYKSLLSGKGPDYEVLAEYPL